MKFSRKKFKKLRLKLGMTQNDFATRAGIWVQQVSEYERGLREPTTKRVAQLAKALKTEFMELME
jgi:transcriptional regulator with XRE-family HTH domain